MAVDQRKRRLKWCGGSYTVPFALAFSLVTA
jgi:hypothetical protein